MLKPQIQLSNKLKVWPKIYWKKAVVWLKNMLKKLFKHRKNRWHLRAEFMAVKSFFLDKKTKLGAGIVVVVLGLVFLGALVYQILFWREIADFLPQTKTVNIFSLTISDQKTDWRKEVIAKLNKVGLPTDKLNLSDETKDFSAWMSPRVKGGYLLMEQGWEPVLFLTINHPEIFKKTQINLKDDQIALQFLTLSRFLVVSFNPQVFQEIEQVQKKQVLRLSQDRTYAHLVLSDKKYFDWLYFNLPLLTKQYLGQIPEDWQVFARPFLEKIGGSVLNFKLFSDQPSWFSLSVDAPPGVWDFFNQERFYRGGALAFLPDFPTLVYAGNDFFSLVQSGAAFYEGEKLSLRIVFESLIRHWLKTYVGEGLDWEEDLLDFSRGEFALGLNWEKTKPAGELVLEVQDVKVAQAKLEKIERAFKQTSRLRLVPRVREFVLPDGTVGKEVYAEPDIYTEGKENYRETTLFYLNFKTGTFHPAYFWKEHFLIITSSLDLAKKTLDQFAQKENAYTLIWQTINQKTIGQNFISLDLKKFWPNFTAGFTKVNFTSKINARTLLLEGNFN